MVQQRYIVATRATQKTNAVESPSSPTIQEKETKDDVTAEKVEDIKEEHLLNGPAHLEQVNRENTIESPLYPTQDKATKANVTAEKVEDVKEENLLNGPAATQSHLEQVKREDAIESPSSPTQDKTKDDGTAEKLKTSKGEIY